MPCYEFMCSNEDCKHIEEFIRKFSEDSPTEICSKCGEVMYKTVNTPLWLKGDGYWERNDYQNRSKHDLEDALRENDEHQRRFDKIRKEEEKVGIYQGD